MLSLPEKYRKNNHIPMRPFLEIDLSSAEKKRFKEVVEDINIEYQIEGFDIPNLVNNEYNCQVIAFVRVKVSKLKDAVFLNRVMQKAIKTFCVMQFVTEQEECFGFAFKRLNKQDNTQIVLENCYVTAPLPFESENQQKSLLYTYVDYTTIQNRENKVAFYAEMMTKAFLIFNDTLFSKTQELLDSRLWFSLDSTLACQSLLAELKDTKASALKTAEIAKRAELNRKIKTMIKQLEELL